MAKTCVSCNKETTNPKFCSKSCAATTNNKIPKRKRKIKYCKCGKEINNQNQFCPTCLPNYRDWSQISLNDTTGKRKYQMHSRIRQLARKIYYKYMKGKELKCCNCGYNKHIEICHIKPVYAFDPKTKISEINDIANLIGLCRNCHWEFDNKLLTLDFTFLAEFTKQVSLLSVRFNRRRLLLSAELRVQSNL